MDNVTDSAALDMVRQNMVKVHELVLSHNEMKTGLQCLIHGQVLKI